MSGSRTTTQQGTQPSAFQMPYLQQIFSEAQRLYSSAPPKQYGAAGTPSEGASWTAGFTPAQQEAQSGLMDYARTGGNGVISGAQGASRFALNDVLSPDTNPYLKQYAQSSLQPLVNTFNRSVLPGIKDASTMGGGYGGSRMGIAEGNAAGDLTNAISNQVSNLYNTGYGQGLNTFNNALNLQPSLYTMGSNPYLMMSQVGSQQQQLNQAGINQSMNMWDYNQNLPYNMLSQYLGYVSGDYGSQGTAETSGPKSLFEQWFGSPLI